MEAKPRRGASDYAVRALAVVLGAAAVHGLLASILLRLLVGDAERAGQAASVALCVLLTALAQLAFLYVRSQYASPDHVARSLPWVSWTTPPLASIALGSVTVAVPDGPPLPSLTLAIAPVFAACVSVGLVVGVVLDRLLRVLAAAYPDDAAEPTLLAPTPPTLANSYVRIMLACALASGVVAAVAVLLPQLPRAPNLEVVWWVLGVALLMAWAPLAAATLGMSPGEDIRSLARRLDGYDDNAAEATRRPVVVTRGDEVGALLSTLESLRVKLRDELLTYQSALQRTRDADARKAGFLSAVSHELRTPLNAVGGFAQLLLEGQGGSLSEAQTEDVELIRDGGRQLLELINDILDMSMIESGELRLSFASTDVAEIVRQVVKIHQPLVHEDRVQLHAEIGPNLPPVVCDPRRLRQILTNLVSNAIKFTERGSITLRVAHDARREAVVVRCIDTGVGIAADDLVSIFDEYRQVGSVKRRSKGTGLGLAIARRIAGYHGGTLHAGSTLGEGSVFTLRLPLEPPERRDTIDITEEDARARTHQRMSPDTVLAGGDGP